MKHASIIATTAALACVLGMGGLTACSNTETTESTASSSAASSVSTLEDEQLIREDLESALNSAFSAEAIAETLRQDSGFKQYENLGLDTASYVKNMAKLISVKVESVKVNGDDAVAKAKLITPDFGDAASGLVEAAFEKASQETDISALSSTEQMQLMLDTVNDVLTDPDFPTESTDLDIDYEKVNGTWVMEDQAELESALQNATSSSPGL